VILLQKKFEMRDNQRYKAERLIYRHVLLEAHKAGIITFAIRKIDPRALLLPGRENTWWRYIVAKSRVYKAKKKLPNIEESTRLHPPINAIVKELLRGKKVKCVKPQEHKEWVQKTLKAWKERDCPSAGPQLVNNTLLLIEGKKGQLFLHRNEPQEKIRFVVGADLLKAKEEKKQENQTSRYKSKK